MSGIDLAILLVVLASAIFSYVRGFFREFVSFATWVVAIWVTATYSSRFATVLSRDAIESPAARAALSALALFLGSMFLGALINALIGKIVSGRVLGVTDRALGVLFGLARGSVIVLLLVFAASLVPQLRQEAWWRQSLFLPRLQELAGMIHARLPTELAQYFDFRDFRPASS